MSLALFVSFTRSFYHKLPRVTFKYGFTAIAIASVPAYLRIAEVAPLD